MFNVRVLLICLLAFVGYGCQTTSDTTEETEQKEEQQEQQTQSEASQSQEASEAKQSAQAQESSESQSSKQAQNKDEQAEKAPEPAAQASQEQQAAEEAKSQAQANKSDSEAGEPASETDVLAQALEAFEQAGQPPPSGTEKNAETAANSGANESGEKSQNEPPAGGSPAGAQTKSEKIAGLDRQLESSYATFDGAILREREYIKGKESARGSVNADLEEEQASAAGEGDELNIPRADLEENAEYGSKQRSGDAEEGGDQQARVASAVSVPPPDIPSGTDDDVVARQLREAALKEPDPELREKLWDEYRKYKKLPPRQK